MKRDVTIRPSWMRGEKVTVKPGAFNVTFTARHPISKLTASCTTTVYVVGELRNFCSTQHAINFHLKLQTFIFSSPHEDGEPPTLDFCPTSQKHKIEKHHESIKVNWIEPKFSDNVKVTEVSKTNVRQKHFDNFRSINGSLWLNEHLINFSLLSLFFHDFHFPRRLQKKVPGSLFGLGSHQIIYEARDAAGYTNRCSFKVVVNAPRRRGLKLPIENHNKFFV